ncbi:MAG: PCYCGC motif-containing (lipo)protein [Vicinamibacterales bacterium]
MNPNARPFRFLLGLAGLGLIMTVVVAANQTAPQRTPAAVTKPAPKSATAPSAAKAPMVKYSVPPLPSVGFAAVRPMDIVRATYDFAAQHPEVLKFVPCYCGCGAQGHKANESCFVARRDAKGNVLEWDTHGFGCTICVDVAREAMQLYASGADVHSIRAAIERKWTPGNAGGKTPTPQPPAKKTS